MMLRLAALLAAVLSAGAFAAQANDTTAVLGTGGLIFGNSVEIAMEKEDLFISPDKVTVDYVFRNTSERDIQTIVAFPMPDIEAGPYAMVAIPDYASDNFLGFSVEMGGLAIKPNLEQRAFAAGIDVTDELSARGIPLMPLGDAAFDALKNVPDDTLQDWVRRGIVIPNEYDDEPDTMVPYWRLRSTYWWDATFRAGEAVEVSHEYMPSVGGTAGTSFYDNGAFNENAAAYKTKYCMDDGFRRAIEKSARNSPDGYPRLTETWISYVLTTGGNWALGTIGDFTLTIDKGDPSNIVSFCGSGVRKIGPTTFQMKARDFYPERDVDILIMRPYTDGG